MTIYIRQYRVSWTGRSVWDGLFSFCQRTLWLASITVDHSSSHPPPPPAACRPDVRARGRLAPATFLPPRGVHLPAHFAARCCFCCAAMVRDARRRHHTRFAPTPPPHCPPTVCHVSCVRTIRALAATTRTTPTLPRSLFCSLQEHWTAASPPAFVAAGRRARPG